MLVEGILKDRCSENLLKEDGLGAMTEALKQEEEWGRGKEGSKKKHREGHDYINGRTSAEYFPLRVTSVRHERDRESFMTRPCMCSHR